MKVVIAGGSGHVGAALIRHFLAAKGELVVLSRKEAELPEVRVARWDGESIGAWTRELENADAVINLAGRSVNCRYDDANLHDMMESRVRSTRVIGQAIQQASCPPRLWLQASTATIYAHRFDAANDEATGILEGDEPNAPRTWNASIAIAKAWEKELDLASTPRTRKIAMRSAMTMSPDKGSVFDVLCRLAEVGLGGSLAGGRQYVSWVHETDFCRAIDFLVEHEELAGPVNICSPEPVHQAEFMRILRKELGVPFALSTPKWMIELGTWLLRTESELVLKSRRVVPTRLVSAGFEFTYPRWKDAARELVSRRSSPTR